MMSAYHYLFIAENNTLVSALVRSVLSREDELFTARDPLEAVRLMDRARPDAILWALDISDEEAIVACRTLRRYSQAPIVVLIHTTTSENILRGYRLGADAHISIPCDRREFTARVHALLRRGQA